MTDNEQSSAMVGGVMSTLNELILDDLRWKPDQAIINHEGESVWLKQVWYDEPVLIPGFFGPTGKWHEPISSPGYITDCCFTAAPCERHDLRES